MRALLVALALVPGAVMAEPSVVGYWYGRGEQPGVGAILDWLAIRRSDGRFFVEFRKYQNCRLQQVVREAGEWSVSGDTYSTRTLAIDGRILKKPYHDEYRLLSVDDHEMRYLHLGTEHEFKVRRVGEDFVFPPCGA
jgi:hypothetical protein